MTLGVLCILSKGPERLSDCCFIDFSDLELLELMSGLDRLPVVIFLRQPNTGEINKGRDGLGSLVPMVHEPINQFANLAPSI